MNFADLEKTWRSPLNRPDPSALEHLKQAFLAEHDRRRLAHKRFLGFVVAVLVFFTLKAFSVASFLRGETPPGLDLAREWAALLFLLIPWAGVVILARQLSRHDRDHGATRTVADGIRALLAENRVSRLRVRVAAGLHLCVLILLPLVVWQLRAVGKAGDEILVPAFVAWPLIAAGILAGLWWHDRRKLQPRQRELEALLKSYE
jgi:hypothetical protein